MRRPEVSENPKHLVETQRLNQKVTIFLEGEAIAETTNAVKVMETGYEDVIYIPKNDIKEIDLIKSSDYFCPFKGHAELYTLRHGARDIENAAWSYDDPFDSLSELQGRVAFYPDKVQEIRITQ